MDLLSFIFPNRCVGCGKIGRYFCDRCRSTIKIIGSNEAICPICQKLAVDGATHPHCRTLYTIDGLTSFFRYDGVIKKAIKAIKYRYISDSAQKFIELIPLKSVNALYFLCHSGLDPESIFSKPGSRHKGRDDEMLVPIPLHPSRFRFRGFNQAEVLGKLLVKRLNINVSTDFLKRIKKTVPQVEMKDRKKRLENMKDVFALNNPEIKLPMNIILFDDVYTTGATLRSAANILKRAGASKVWGMTMAR